MKSLQVHAFLLAVISLGSCGEPLVKSAFSQGPPRETVLREVEKTFGDPPAMVRLDPSDRVWADKDKRRVIVDGYIALREGPLEMLACLVGTKEHESIVATFCKAQTVHAGLLAVGAEQGKPVQWEPTFRPPSGSEIQVSVLWVDKNGQKKNIDAREWVKVMDTEKDVLDKNFVFAGSLFWEDPDTRKKIYQAESGDLICVSNFSTATLDVPIESSKVNSGLMFMAFTERIPPVGTPVRLVLQVVDGAKSKNIASENPSKAGAQPEKGSTSQEQAPAANQRPKFPPIPGLDEIK